MQTYAIDIMQLCAIQIDYSPNKFNIHRSKSLHFTYCLKTFEKLLIYNVYYIACLIFF